MSLAYQLLAFGLVALLVARITRLINADTILDGFRVWLSEKERLARLHEYQEKSAGREALAKKAARSARRWHAVNYLVYCPWCVSIWLAVPTAPLVAWWVGLPIGFGVMYGFGVSHLVGVFSRYTITEAISIEGDDQ